jgi:hypothetical protein
MAASALASMALQGIRSEEMLATAIAGLADEAAQVRQSSLSVIASHGPEASVAVPALVALHAQNDDQVGGSPIYSALQRIGPAAKEALPLLRKAAVANSGSDAMAVARSHYDAMAAAAALAVVAEEPKEIEGAVQVLIDALADETQRGMALHHLKVVGPRAKRAAFIMRVWMMKPSFWQLNAAAALLRMEGAKASDAADVLAKALAGEQAGAAMRQLREVGPEGAALIPAVLAHAKDLASQWRAGGLIALIDMQARGEGIREVFAVARKDKTAWIRTLGARGLKALDEAKAPR